MLKKGLKCQRAQDSSFKSDPEGMPVVVTDLVLTVPPVYSTLAWKDAWLMTGRTKVRSQDIQARNKTLERSLKKEESPDVAYGLER